MSEKGFLTYKGKPIVRKGDVLYYGDMADAYIIRLTVLSKDGDIAGKIKIELMLSDTSLSDKERTSKTSEKLGFYEAMDFASVWLTRANKQ